MQLGIKNKKAIVCGGSSGLGFAIAKSLAAEGADVLLVARTPEKLELAARSISEETDASVDWISADLAEESDRQNVLERCTSPDILINNAGGPPIGDFSMWSSEDWHRAIDTNLLSALGLIQLSIEQMKAKQFGRIVCITSHMVKAPLGLLSLSNAARSALTGVVGGIARDVASYNITLNNVLPGQFDTGRLQSNYQMIADRQNLDLDAVRNNYRSRIPAGRFGSPNELGDFCTFLCSEQAGYITGQNFLLDGGEYPGLL
jgi:3-oxoacyl-[acyl-carrier protein] reductase